MKKPAAKRRKPVRRKPTANAAKVRLGLADIEAIERLIADQGNSLVDMIEELIDSPLESPDDMPDPETVSELADGLERVRIDANGGDHEARETLKAVHGIIDRAARRDDIDPRILMVLGHLFAAAQLDIGEAARASMARSLRPLGSDGGAIPSIVPPSLVSGSDDPFSLYEQISALIDILPTKDKGLIVEALAAERAAQGPGVAVGFLLHRDKDVALAAIRGLAAADARGALEPEGRRRIRMIRNWLTPALRDALDAAIPSAEAAEPRGPVKLVRAMASACDGSGASALYATAATGSRFVVASLMAKPTGVAEALLFEDLPKNEAASFLSALDEASPTSEVSLATFSRLIRLALGRNMARGAPPPFSLVRIIEALGIEDPVPDLAAPAEIIDATLAELNLGDGAESIREAHSSILDDEIADGWFEAGADVDAILETTDSPEDAAQALLESYLPRRRAFWADQCALSALAMRDFAARGGASKRLAIVGRDILNDLPLGDIPLMRQIAERSALAYFMRN